MTEHQLPLIDDGGRKLGLVTIATLPGSDQWREQPAMRFNAEADFGAPLQLLEELNYRYQIDAADVHSLEPSELFGPDGPDIRTGRLSTGRSTGTIEIVVVLASGQRAKCQFEVRSRKLNYETEYRRMMSRIADEAAELVQSAFASSTFVGFDPSGTEPAATLYQRFAFVAAELESERFAEAMDVIRNRPHSTFRTVVEEVHPGTGAPPSHTLVRQLSSSGARRSTAVPIAGSSTVPRRLCRETHVATFDTPPNRFVRFALEHWRSLVVEAGRALPKDGADARRGRAQAEQLESLLNAYLSIPALAEAGDLDRFPASNTVLGSRAGYREVFRSFLLSDAAASLTWGGGDDVFGAGQRDVATLYEYWVFLELARIIESISGMEFDRSALVREVSGGLNLDLQRGNEVVLAGTGSRRGRSISLKLCFNRTFRAGPRPDDSWTVEMRPDCSLQISVEGPDWQEPVWVHFDAKYRLADYRDFFGQDKSDAAASVSRGRAKSDDMRKMHAYRDAIRRTSGAYVIYPGEDSQIRETHLRYHEVLPGLGAFVLRPAASGEATATAGAYLKRFLVDVIDHTASQGTARERSQYWQQRSYASRVEHRRDFEGALRAPADDTIVLLGYVRGAGHWAWIEEHSLYNLRADPNRRGSVGLESPALRADILLLYDETGRLTAFRSTSAVFVRSGDELLASGYPARKSIGSLYLCLGLGDQVNVRLHGGDVQRVAGTAAPAAMPWSELIDAIEGSA